MEVLKEERTLVQGEELSEGEPELEEEPLQEETSLIVVAMSLDEDIYFEHMHVKDEVLSCLKHN